MSQHGVQDWEKQLTRRTLPSTELSRKYHIDLFLELIPKNPTQEEQEEDQLSEMANTKAPVKRKTLPTTECESRKRTRIEVNSRQIEYNEKMKKSRQKPQTLNTGDFVSIKIDLLDKTPFHPNVLMGEIVAFENEYPKVACKFGIISTLISPARLVKCQATNIKISKDKEITFTKACKMAIEQ